MFSITDFEGFSVTFPNGYRLSTKFGPNTYCDNFNESIVGFLNDPSSLKSSTTAETAVIKDESEQWEMGEKSYVNKDKFIPVRWNDESEQWEMGEKSCNDVQGYVTVEQWIKLVAFVASL